ncbi:iron permease [Mycena rebaudengoi]|nr:iron permease [Mycena rebaudengoi]
MSISAEPADEPTAREDLAPATSAAKVPKTRAFWMSFLAITVSIFLSAMDLTAIPTSLPTIVVALDDDKGDYSWARIIVGSAYALSSTAVIPLSGSLADIFGRKPIMLSSISLLLVGSVLAGASQNMPMMIAARGVQGLGGGGIIALSKILVSDLVPLAERGAYEGIISLVWAFASAIGPPIGGALSARDNKSWRWLFFLNIPLSGISFLLVAIFLQVRQPEGSILSKLALVDWLGNAIVAAGSGLTIIGLAWGGGRYSWSSAQVLAPLIIGLFLLVVFAFYEAKVPRRPTIPLDIFANRTSLSAILTTAIHGIVNIFFFQACLSASPLRSAVDTLPLALSCSPFVVAAGAIITLSQKYRVVNWAGWCITIVAFGLLSTIKSDSVTGMWVGYQLVVALGIGVVVISPVFPLLAPLPPDRAAAALSLFSFTRLFFQTWGITISSTILQNTLQNNLPADFVAQFPPGFEIAYAAIPRIQHLPEPLRSEVRVAFADSLAVIWQTMIGLAGLGLLLSFMMKEGTND